MAKRSDIENNKNYSKTPIYPSRLQSTAYPETVYIFGIGKLLIVAVILFTLTGILGVANYVKFKNKGIGFGFMYWSEEDQQFKKKDFYNLDEDQLYLLTTYEVVAEKFIRDYIINRYSIFKDSEVNKKNWCDCLDSKNDDLGCIICKQSITSNKESDVYTAFRDIQLPKSIERANEGIERSIKILKIDQITPVMLRTSKIKPNGFFEDIVISTFNNVVGIFTGGAGSNYYGILIYYKIDFAVIDRQAGGIVNIDVWTSNNAIENFTNREIEDFTVIQHDTSFHPNPDYMIKKYIPEYYNKK